MRVRVCLRACVCVCVVYFHGVGVLVTICACSLIPIPYFHSEVGIEIGTVYETSVGVCTCECVFVYMCIYVRVQDRYLYCTLLPMVCVGFPTRWCLPSPCVHWDKSTCPSAIFPCTASTDDTTCISTITGLCVVWVGMCECVILTAHFVYAALRYNIYSM